MVIFSCQQNDMKENKDVVDYLSIGREHNEGLAVLFNNLKFIKTNNQSNKLQFNDYISMIEHSTIEFTLNNHKDMSEFSIQELKRNVSSMKSTLIDFSSSKKDNEFVHDKIIETVSHLLTVKQNNMYSKF